MQYDGDWTPDAVKKRIVEILYGWTLGLPNEPKIAEAYKMLKQQGKYISFSHWHQTNQIFILGTNYFFLFETHCYTLPYSQEETNEI